MSYRETTYPRPSTQEQERRREANRCPNVCPPQEGIYVQASGARCIRKSGHDGPCKIDFGWKRFPFYPEDE